jgi:hypothetical protein
VIEAPFSISDTSGIHKVLIYFIKICASFGNNAVDLPTPGSGKSSCLPVSKPEAIAQISQLTEGIDEF